MDTITFVPIEKIIVNQYQPAEFIDQAQVLEIAESLRRYRDNGQKGLLQVPLARRVNGVYEEAFGRHRLLAFQHLAKEDPFWKEMPLLIKDLSDQEMFELMGVENFKRRDISVIEKARIFQDHMTRFDKNSVETAETFGVSEEFVRGTVRLLNLPAPAQEAVHAGKINITAARSLLSMQKIAPANVIAETVKQLEQGVDKYNRPSTPEETIEYAIRNLDESVHMWNDNRDGKPRSHMGYNEPGWLLSNKSFPNKLLPKLTPVDAAIALGIQDDEAAMESVGEYLYALYQPEDYGDVEDAQAAAQLHRDRLVTRDSVLWDKLQHLLNPPACSSCPFYTRMNGAHYCGMKTCHTRKNQAWHAHILQQAVNNLRIPLYEKKDGKYQVLTYDHEKLFTARNKDLRLIPRDQVKGFHYQHFTGVEDAVFLVVMTGKTLENKTTAIKEARAVERQTQTAAERRNELIDQHQDLLEWEATLPVKALLDGFNLPALDALEDAAFDWQADDDDVPEVYRLAENVSEEVRTDYRRRLIALSMLREAKGRYEAGRDKNCESWALWLCDTLVSWGLKAPRGFVKAAQSFDEQIREAVTAETAKSKKNGKKS